MIARTKILLIGLVGAGAALGLAAATAKASPKPPASAPPPSADNMPWLRYSDATLARQEDYNEWAAAHGFPTIKADGILGPATCRALTDWFQNGGPAVPAACATLSNKQTCADAAMVRDEYLRLQERINNGTAFSGDEEHAQDLWNELVKLERLCGDIVLTGTGTRQ